MNEIWYRAIVGGIFFVTFTVRAIYDVRKKSRPVNNRSEQEDSTFASVLVKTTLFLVLLQLFGFDLVPMKLGIVTDNLVRCCGVVLVLIGAVLMTWSRVIPGRRAAWSSPITSPDRIPGHRLVTWGPYRYIRHPLYGGIILGGTGIELAVTSYLLLLVPLLVMYGLLGIGKEEIQLEAAYGDAYRDYKRRTWRFVPFLF